MSHVHHRRVLEVNAQAGPGRGPAPAPGVDRWDWKRWVLWDSYLLDELDALTPDARGDLMRRWPARWPSPESGLMSVRQIHWAIYQLIRRQPPLPGGTLS